MLQTQGRQNFNSFIKGDTENMIFILLKQKSYETKLWLLQDLQPHILT